MSRFAMRIYHGWIIVAVSVVAYTLILGSTIISFGVYVVPVSNDLGLSRASMNTAYVLTSIGGGLLGPIVGRLLDRFPAKPILAISAILWGLGLVILGTASSMWVCVLALALLIPIGTDGAGFVSMNVLVARWFTVNRARAMALSVLGFSLAGIVMPPTISFLIEQYGWRSSLVISGVCASAVLVVLSLIIRERPTASDIEPGSERKAAEATQAVSNTEAPRSMMQILRMPMFWWIGISVSIVLAVNATIQISLVPLGLGRALSATEATSLLSIVAAVSVVSKLLLASFGDRVDGFLLLAVIFVVSIPLNLALIYAHGYALMLGCAVVLGLASGALLPTFQTILADQFGVKSFGTVRGLAIPLSAVTTAAAMRLAGEVFDRQGNYTLVLVVFCALSLLSIGMILRARLNATKTPRSS